MGERKDITIATIKTLFARSSNRCAFPECKSPLVGDDNLLVREIAHIHAVVPNGPRYDGDLEDEYLRSHDNLLVWERGTDYPCARKRMSERC